MNTRRLSRSREPQAVKPSLPEQESVKDWRIHPQFQLARDMALTINERKPESIQQLQSKIENSVPFSFVKRGDGEDLCMAGSKGENCDGAAYTPFLMEGLKWAFTFLRKYGAYIVSFADYPMPWNMLLHTPDGDLQSLKSFFWSIRTSSHKKVFVGPERSKDLCRLLKTEFIPVPLHNAADQYDRVLEELKGKLTDGGIYLFSAGFPAKIWIAAALQCNPRITCLDLGSSFDSLLVGPTRWLVTNEISSQPSQEIMKELYADFE